MNLLARSSPLVVAVIVAGMSPGFAPVKADELPADTNTIESLTPEQARKLVKEFPGVPVKMIVKARDEGEITQAACLPLNGLKSVDAETAAALAVYDKGPLLLNGLTTLSDEAADALAQHRGRWLALNGLTTISDEAAEALGRHKSGWLVLDGLTTLSDEAAKALARHQLWLSLNGPTTLSDGAANAFALRTGQALYLNGLTTLSDEAARALGQHQGADLCLNGVTTLSDEAVKALARHRGGLSLGLTTLSEEAADALSQRTGRLSLKRLTTLSAAAIRALTQSEGRLPDLDLGSFRETFFAENPLTPDSAPVWAALLKGDLSAVTALDSPDSVAIAQALATRKGPLFLPNLRKISPKTLSALIEKEDVVIPLVETLELIPEPDGSPTDDFIIPDWLEERQIARRRRQAARVPE